MDEIPLSVRLKASGATRLSKWNDGPNAGYSLYLPKAMVKAFGAEDENGTYSGTLT